MYRRLGGPQGQSEQVQKILPPHRDLIRGPSTPLGVTIPTELSQPQGRSAGNKNSSCQVSVLVASRVTPQTVFSYWHSTKACSLHLHGTVQLSPPPTWYSTIIPITGNEGSERSGIALAFLNLSAKWGLVVDATLQPLYPQKGTWYPMLGAGWASEHLHHRHWNPQLSSPLWATIQTPISWLPNLYSKWH